MGSASHAVVPNPFWFCQDLSSFSSVLGCMEGVGESWNMTATFKVLSCFKEKWFWNRIPLTLALRALEEKTMSGNMEHV